MLEYAFLTFGSLFAIVDPFAAIPAFLAMTADDGLEARVRMARTASMVCWLVMSLFALMGPAIFKLFGVTITAFQIAGGLIMLLSALDMLRAKRSALNETPEEFEEGSAKDNVAITPLAIPMLAGPGAITTSIVLGSRAEDFAHKVVFFGLIAVVAFLTYVILAISAKGARKISPTILNVVTRLMGLMLAAIGVQFILTALKLGAKA